MSEVLSEEDFEWIMRAFCFAIESNLNEFAFKLGIFDRTRVSYKRFNHQGECGTSFMRSNIQIIEAPRVKNPYFQGPLCERGEIQQP